MVSWAALGKAIASRSMEVIPSLCSDYTWSIESGVGQYKRYMDVLESVQWRAAKMTDWSISPMRKI